MNLDWFKHNWLLLLVVMLAGIFRLVGVLKSDLPTGDEINCYIYNAQQFAEHGRIPPLSDHPGVSMIYGVVITVTEAFCITLSGVVAANIVTVISGVLSVLFVYLALLHFSNRQTAFLASLILSVFPGCYFAVRGDLSLYFLFLSAFLFSLSCLSAKPSWRMAMITGILGGCLYLCRSDGLYLVILTFILAFFVLKEIRLYIPLTAIAFCLLLGLFLVIRFGVMGNLGTGTGQRAFDAFYQAEGLLDHKGGSWQDYTERGLKRYGLSEKYGNSMARLVVENHYQVYERIKRNLLLVSKYIRDASGIDSGWIVLILACCMLNTRILKMAIISVLPCIFTSCIYLAFYFQRTYFVMFSFGLVLGCTAGLSALVFFISNKFKFQAHAFTGCLIIGALVASLMGYETYRSFPGSKKTTTAKRYWDSLIFLKENCVNGGYKYFAYDHAGSRSMYIYTGGGEPEISQGEVEGNEVEQVLGKLRLKGVRFVLAQKENHTLWGLSDHSSVVFSNKRDDVRIIALK